MHKSFSISTGSSDLFCISFLNSSEIIFSLNIESDELIPIQIDRSDEACVIITTFILLIQRHSNNLFE